MGTRRESGGPPKGGLSTGRFHPGGESLPGETLDSRNRCLKCSALLGGRGMKTRSVPQHHPSASQATIAILPCESYTAVQWFDLSPTAASDHEPINQNAHSACRQDQ
jgi:hypothetical protein